MVLFFADAPPPLPPPPQARAELAYPGGPQVVTLPDGSTMLCVSHPPLSDIPIPVQAITDSEVFDVTRVVVTAARLKPAPSDAAFAVTTVQPDTLEAVSRIDEALTLVPGVQLFRRTSSVASNPTTQGITVRAIAGSGAGRALVTLDGVPQNDPFGGWVLWSGLPPAAIEGALVVRGAGAGPYGAGALTGTVQLQERTRVP
ncbi:MAG: Plug domain-containing protein, partial [Pseudomonadota bacterium]